MSAVSSMTDVSSQPRYLSLSPPIGFVVLCLAAILGAVVAIVEPPIKSILVVGLVGVLAGPLVARLVRSRFDPFEPIVVANLALLFMFVARPVADLFAAQTIHIGYDILPTFDQTLVVAVLGAASLQVGYFLPLGARLARWLPTPPQDLHEDSALAFALFILLFGVALFSIFLVQTGASATVSSLLAGRQPSQNSLYLSSTGYFYNGLILTAPASLILFSISHTKRRRALFVGAIAAMSLLAILGILAGNRLSLLVLFGPPILFWYLARNRRPRVLSALLASYLILTVGIGFLRDSRTQVIGSPDTRIATLAQSLLNPTGQAASLILGSDDEMFDSLASELAVVPSTLPFQHGATIVDIAIRSVPRPLWPEKPLERNDAVVTTLWPAHYASSRASPAFSILGPLYADSGWVTVVIGMLLVGVLLAALWWYFQACRTVPAIQMLYATSLPLVIVLLRGSIPDTLSYMLFTIVPLGIVIRIAAKRGGDQ